MSASEDETLKVWDVHTGEERLTLRGHTGEVFGCAISPAGDTIVSASDDHTLKVWDARTGEERRTLRGHSDAVHGCAISPAGDYIVSASETTHSRCGMRARGRSGAPCAGIRVRCGGVRSVRRETPLCRLLMTRRSRCGMRAQGRNGARCAGIRVG